MARRRSRLTFLDHCLNSTRLRFKQSACAIAVLLLATSGLGQSPSKPDSQAGSQDTTASAKSGPEATTVSVPAGTEIALVLTHPIQSRYIHRGDDIYAQIVAPITRGNEVVIPEGTLVNGKFDKLGRHGNRGELYLQSMSIAFSDGYVATVAGPILLQSDQGYAWKDPGNGRTAGLAIGPLAGGGLGALIGHSAAQPTTITNTLPPGCTGGPPQCLTSSLSVPPDKGKDTIIGAAIGSGLGVAAGLLLVGTSHHFFLDAGTPVEMTLQHPLILPEDQVGDAIRDAEEHPETQQPIEPQPLPPPPPGNDAGICWTPGTPGTPDIDIPGTPPIGDSPGSPAVHIPGTPGTPPTPHPCPQI